MTDRELLEAAAEAAGIKVVRSRLDDPLNRDFLIEDSPMNREQAAGPWNPLTNDGDAFRLAVKLRINIEHMAMMSGKDFGINAWPRSRGDCGWSEYDDLSDYAAAARRAIIRAAAALTPSMESKE